MITDKLQSKKPTATCYQMHTRSFMRQWEFLIEIGAKLHINTFPSIYLKQDVKGFSHRYNNSVQPCACVSVRAI
mgnify:CR=1 FL=1